MKKTMSLWLGIVTGAVVFGGVTYAQSGVSKIHASYDNIQLIVNGQKVSTTAEPFIYNKNVYVPVSTVGHALDATVKWINKPAEVQVLGADKTLKPFKVYVNGTELPSGITDGKNIYSIPATTSGYESATGLVPSTDSSGNINFENQNPPVISSGAPIFTLTPLKLYGDFSNTNLYPQQDLIGFWTPTVLGQIYPAQYAIEWGVGAGQKSVVPGMDYTLGGNYQTFTGQFAIDDLSRNFGGAVQLTFVGDGKTLGSTGWVQSASQPTPFSVNVTGVNVLEIQYQLKLANGTVYNMGQTYQAPTKNPDGTTDPIVVTDLMEPTLVQASTSSSGSSSVNNNNSTGNSSSTATGNGTSSGTASGSNSGSSTNSSSGNNSTSGSSGTSN